MINLLLALLLSLPLSCCFLPASIEPSPEANLKKLIDEQKCEEIKKVIEKNPELLGKSLTPNFNTPPLLYALYSGKRSTFFCLLQMEECKIGDNSGVLLLPIKENWEDKIIELVINKWPKAEKNKLFAEDTTQGIFPIPTFHPLNWAVVNNKREIVEVLIQKGADVNWPFSSDLHKIRPFPLMNAAYIGNLEMVELLLNSGADPHKIDWDKRAALQCAFIQPLNDDRLEIIKLLLDRCTGDQHKAYINSYTPGTQWKTPLCVAVMERRKNIVESLLDKGADIYAPSYNGYTALHYAAQSEDVSILEFLLSKTTNKNNINIKSNTFNGGNTPLHLAASKAHFEAVEILLKNGADKAITDNNNKTALDIALSCKQHYEHLQANGGSLANGKSPAEEIKRCQKIINALTPEKPKLSTDASKNFAHCEPKDHSQTPKENPELANNNTRSHSAQPDHSAPDPATPSKRFSLSNFLKIGGGACMLIPAIAIVHNTIAEKKKALTSQEYSQESRASFLSKIFSVARKNQKECIFFSLGICAFIGGFLTK